MDSNMRFILYILLVSIVSLLIISCSNDSNLKFLGCINLKEAKTDNAPPDLFSASVECANNNEPIKAAHLFLFARIYWAYDSKRVSDKTGSQVIKILMDNSFRAMKENADNVEDAINKKLINNPQEFNEFCNIVKSIGKPNYYPKYMISHGMKAVMGKIDGNGIKSDFNEQKAWIETMKQCS